jgi:hypothetical protein
MVLLFLFYAKIHEQGEKWKYVQYPQHQWKRFQFIKNKEEDGLFKTDSLARINYILEGYQWNYPDSVERRHPNVYPKLLHQMRIFGIYYP